MTDDERKARKLEQQRRSNKRYYAAHQAEMVTRSRTYYAANRHKPRAKRDPAKISAYNKAYAAANKERLAAASKTRWTGSERAARMTLPTRFCRTCQTEKASAEFWASYQTQCRSCLQAKAAPTYAQKRAYIKQWQRDNREKVKAWFRNNREYLVEWKREWYVRKPEMKARAKQRTDAYYRKNPHLFRANGARREAAQLQATPAWADRAAIARIYSEALRLTRATGVPHEVDHIVPLRSKVVCGLHCEENLQILTKAANRQKSNLLTHTNLRPVLFDGARLQN